MNIGKSVSPKAPNKNLELVVLRPASVGPRYEKSGKPVVGPKLEWEPDS